MATLSRVDGAGLFDRPADVDLPDPHSAFFADLAQQLEPESHAIELSGVAARPSREFSAYDDTVEIQPETVRSGWLGLILAGGALVAVHRALGRVNGRRYVIDSV